MTEKCLAQQFAEEFLETNKQPTDEQIEQFEHLGSFEIDDQDFVKYLADVANVKSSSPRSWFILFNDMSHIVLVKDGLVEAAPYKAISSSAPDKIKERMELIEEFAKCSSDFAQHLKERLKVAEGELHGETETQKEAEEDSERVSAYFVDLPVIIFGVIALTSISILVDTNHWGESAIIGAFLGLLFSAVAPIFHRDN